MSAGVRPAPAQLELRFDAPRAPRPSAGEGAALLAALRGHGLAGVEHCRLTRNGSVMVSCRGPELRVHEGFRSAPNEVLRAIVAFVNGRGEARRRARRVILGFSVERPDGPIRRESTHPGDTGLVERLRQWHERLNGERFGGSLAAVALRVSRRMSARLGVFRLPQSGEPAAIAISRRHIRRHGWDEAVATLLHEMVHQWQFERGLPVDHGTAFRQKARAVGIEPRAIRREGGVAPAMASGGILSACVARSER